MSEAELLDAREVAALLKVTTRWVYRAMKRGELAHVRVGRFVRFRRTEIEAYLDRQSTT